MNAHTIETLALLRQARDRAIARYARTRSYSDRFRMVEATHACLRAGA